MRDVTWGVVPPRGPGAWDWEVVKWLPDGGTALLAEGAAPTRDEAAKEAQDSFKRAKAAEGRP